MGLDALTTFPPEKIESLLKVIGLQPIHERAFISLDFPIREIPWAQRKTVAEAYNKEDYPPEFAQYVVVADILSTGDQLIVPPVYGRCHFCSTPAPQVRPGMFHRNHKDFVKLLEDKDGQAR